MSRVSARHLSEASCATHDVPSFSASIRLKLRRHRFLICVSIVCSKHPAARLAMKKNKFILPLKKNLLLLSRAERETHVLFQSWQFCDNLEGVTLIHQEALSLGRVGHFFRVLGYQRVKVRIYFIWIRPFLCS